MKLFFIAGEPSGDLHASTIIHSLLSKNPNLSIQGFGGDKMKRAGAEIVRDLSSLAFMGFVEVVKNASLIKQNFKIAKEAIRKQNPDLIVLVDYPGFNLRMAKWAKQEGYKICYYIAPQVWAWKENRVKELRKYVDLLIPIIPFEQSYFENHNIKVKYHGHPLSNVIEEYKENLKHQNVPKSTIALFPGSRKQEVLKILPIMLSVVDAFPHYNFVIGASSHLDPSIYKSIIGPKTVKVIYNENYEILSKVKLAITTSGTITLETALFNVPQVVCYKTNPLSYRIGKFFIKVKHIALPNLIANSAIVPELIQEKLTKEKLKLAIEEIQSPDQAKVIEEGYKLIKKKVYQSNCIENITDEIMALLNSKNLE